MCLLCCHPDNPTRDPKVKGCPSRTLFVARLNYSTTEATLRREFEQFGSIRRVRLVRNTRTGLYAVLWGSCCACGAGGMTRWHDRAGTGKSRGYAFIEFESDRGFEKAFRRGNGLVIDGWTVLVDWERERLMPGGWTAQSRCAWCRATQSGPPLPL